MNRSLIEWLACWPGRKGYTWNPVTGCSPISPGCDDCWAKRMANRLKGRCGYDADNPFQITFHKARLTEPSKMQKPAAIAVSLMGDLFHPSVTRVAQTKVFDVIRDNKRHTFFCLTKRPHFMNRFISWYVSARNHEILPNLAIGVSVENADYVWRIDELLKIPAAMRFVSCESLLGDLGNLHLCPGSIEDEIDWKETDACGWVTGCEPCSSSRHWVTVLDPDRRCVDWIIAGGESGQKARPCHPDWVRSLRDQCAEARTPFMFKQHGHFAPVEGWRVMCAKPPGNYAFLPNGEKVYHDDPRPVLGWERGTYPDDADCFSAIPLGKNKTGRLLDGKEHMEGPEWFGKATK